MFSVIEDSNVMFNVSRLISELLVSQTHGGSSSLVVQSAEFQSLGRRPQ